MPRPPSPHPTDVELEILQVLWSSGPSSLSGVCETLRTEREVAATTVATMLRVMSDGPRQAHRQRPRRHLEHHRGNIAPRKE